jgi:cytochrome P450
MGEGPPTFDFDPFDRSTRPASVPLERFREMREQCPVAKVPSGVWCVSRYDDAVAVIKDAATFLSDGASRAPGAIVDEADKMTFEIDPPRHLFVRRALMEAVTPARVRSVEPFLRQLVAELVDAMVAQRTSDVVTHLAEPVPSRVIAHLMGLPASDTPRLSVWIREMFESGYLVTNRTEHGEGLVAALPDFMGYLIDQIALRRDGDGDDLISHMIAAEVDGRRFSPGELLAAVMSLIVGGVATTRDLITMLVYRLAITPAVLSAVRHDPDVAERVVEETLRLDPPVLTLGRLSARDAVVGGVRIPAGEKVLVGLASANRDAAAYDRPDEFVLDREGAPNHLTFGAPGGRHFCIGAPLARLEGRVVVETVAALVGSLSLAPDQGDAVPMISSLIIGFPSLRVVALGPHEHGTEVSRRR